MNPLKNLNIWLVTIGEPVPLSASKENRMHRTGAFASYLAEKGHKVIWWTSTFDHFTKKNLFQKHTSLKFKKGLDVRLIHGCGYHKNVSLSRMRNHKQVSRTFSKLIRREIDCPDIIVAAFPTMELASASVEYGKSSGVPVIIDVRDLWPDIFVGAVPKYLRSFAKLALIRMESAAAKTFRESTGIVGISEGYLTWALQKAGIQRRVSDAVFPLGYKRPSVTALELHGAEKESRGKGVEPDKFICWFVGTFGKTYDLAPVIAAAKKMFLKGRNDIQFVFSGTGDRELFWKKMARGLPNIIFTGWINAAQIEFMGRSAKIGLAAYADEAPQGLPNKLFEYFSFGLPVVSSLRGEAEELLRLERCGYPYDRCSPEDLAETVLKLKNNEADRLAAGDRARKLFEKKFSLDMIHPQFLQYIEQVVSRKKK